MEYLMLWSGDMYGMRKARVPAVENTGICGHWRNGKCMVPDMGAIRKALPRRYRAMFDRHAELWFDKHQNDAPAHLSLYYADMYRAHTLYLQPIEVSQ